VVRRVRTVRDEQYGLLRGLFHGEGDDAETMDSAQPRLQAVSLAGGAKAIGRSLEEFKFDEIGVQVRAVRRPGDAHRLAPADAGILQQGDVVVLLGVPERLVTAENRLLHG
jgi:CPA2 family monovalent cation:H+ antiporter-2